MNIFIKIFSFLLFTIVLFSFLANFFLPLKSYSRFFLFPKTSINLGLNYYYQNDFLNASKIFNYFNKWQPTVETLLFEGYCLQKEENFKGAKEIYKKALNFNPKNKDASLALIEVDLKIMEKNVFDKNLMEEIILLIPYDDKNSIDKICIRILKISSKSNPRDKLFIYAYIFYIFPSDFILNKTIDFILKENDMPKVAKNIGLHLYILNKFFYFEENEKKEFLKKIGFIFKKIYEG